MTANAMSALNCESSAFDHLDSQSATCTNTEQLSSGVSLISMDSNSPAAEDKMFQMPEEVSTTESDVSVSAEFSDSDDEEGLPGYPTWGSSWSMRSLRTLDPKRDRKLLCCLEQHRDTLLRSTPSTPTCAAFSSRFSELSYYRLVPLNEMNHRAL